MSRKDELTAAEDKGWTEFDSIVESLSPAQLEQSGYSTEWSVKDLMAHVGAWLAEAGLMLQQIRMGTYTHRHLDVNAMNREFYEANRDVPLNIVRAEYCASRMRMLHEWGLMDEVSPEAEEWFRESGVEHYSEHLRRLREWSEEVRSRA